MIVNRSLLLTIVLCSISLFSGTVDANKNKDRNVRAPQAKQEAHEADKAPIDKAAVGKAQAEDWRRSWSDNGDESFSLSLSDENERPSRDRRDRRRHDRHDRWDEKPEWSDRNERGPRRDHRDRRDHHDRHERCSSHSHHERCDHCKDCPLKVNGGWKEFIFGKAGSFVDACFTFHTQGPSTLRITDNFCTGDIFKVYDCGKLLFETSRARFDNCSTSTTNPDYAFESALWSSGRAHLRPGHHNITIKVVKSPYGAGGANIRVDTEDCHHSVCPSCLHKLTVVNTPVPFHEAEGVCRSLGKQLADLNIYNFLDATTLAFQCAGPFSMVWMKSYWKNTYNNSCLALHTGSAAPGGSINIADCHARLPVLCQELGATDGDGVRPQVDPYVDVVEVLPCNDENPYCRRHVRPSRSSRSRSHSRSCSKSRCSSRSRRHHGRRSHAFPNPRVDPFRSSRLPSGWSSTISSFHSLPLVEGEHEHRRRRHDCDHKKPCHKKECDHKKPCHKKECNNKPCDHRPHDRHERRHRRHRRHHNQNRHSNLNIRHEWADKNNLKEEGEHEGIMSKNEESPIMEKAMIIQDQQ